MSFKMFFKALHGLAGSKVAQFALRQQVAHQRAIATGFGKGLLDALLATRHEDHAGALEAPVELRPRRPSEAKRRRNALRS